MKRPRSSKPGGRRRKGQRLLYYFRTPPTVRVGREALDAEAMRMLEAAQSGRPVRLAAPAEIRLRGSNRAATVPAPPASGRRDRREPAARRPPPRPPRLPPRTPQRSRRAWFQPSRPPQRRTQSPERRRTRSTRTNPSNPEHPSNPERHVERRSTRRTRRTRTNPENPPPDPLSPSLPTYARLGADGLRAAARALRRHAGPSRRASPRKQGRPSYWRGSSV